MDFGDVIKKMKANPSRRFARKGWNGKRMFIYLVEGSEVPAEEWTPRSGFTSHEWASGITILPHIDMYDAQGRRVIGWLASQTDMLADDWEDVTPFNTPEEQRQRIMRCKSRMFEELKDHVPGMFCLGYHPIHNSINDYGWMKAYIEKGMQIRKEIGENVSAYGLYFRIEKESYLDGLLFDVLTHKWDGPMPQIAPCEEVKE